MATDPAEHRIPVGEQEAIANVAKIAAETVVKNRRTKLVTQVGVVTACISLAISIPVTVIITGHNSTVNCELITEMAGVQKERVEEAKPQSELFRKQSKDKLGLTPEQFDQLLERIEKKEKRQLKVYSKIAHHSCA